MFRIENPFGFDQLMYTLIAKNEASVQLSSHRVLAGYRETG